MTYLLWIAAIVYILFPWDLLPDLLPFWGRIDDLIVLYLAWRYYSRWLRGIRTGNDAGPDPSGSDPRTSRNDAGEHGHADPPKSPWTVLGVSPGASAAEIKEAYRRLAGKYHPDKVAHLGEEFRQLAEERFKEIQVAYNELKKRGSG